MPEKSTTFTTDTLLACRACDCQQTTGIEQGDHARDNKSIKKNEHKNI